MTRHAGAFAWVGLWVAVVGLACNDDIPGGEQVTPPGLGDTRHPLPECASEVALRSHPPPALVHVDTARALGAGAVAVPATRSGPLPKLARPPRLAHRQAQVATRVTLRTLLLTAQGTDPAYFAARAALERIGVPFDVHVATSAPFSSVALRQSDGTCRYSSVILSSGSLSYHDDSTGQWTSALSEDEWRQLADYQVECGAREAIWYGYPNADIGMSPTTSFESTDQVAAGLTAAGHSTMSYLRGNASIPITGVWGYRGHIDQPDTTTAWLVASSGEALVVHHTRPDGSEVVAMTFDSSSRSLHSQLLEYGIIDWLGRGLFVGHRRVYLTAQMDDVYLASDLWPVGGNSPDAVGGSYRMTPADVDDLVAWQQQLQYRLPPGSSFVTHLPFNGAGRDEAPGDELGNALDSVSSRFVWVNHTWDHADMDAMASEVARAEMADNCELAEMHGFARFSCAAAVTPHVSGLDNPDAVSGMLAAGVRFVVSDTSVTEEIRPENPGTNPSHNVGRHNPHDPRLFQIPRHPTNIFYNASLPAEEVDLYNFLYREWHGRDLSYDEVLWADTSVALSYLLSYDINPLMFHQANLRFWTGTDGQRHSLYTDWVDLLLERYLALVDLPVVTLTMPDIATAMQDRAAYNQCGAHAVWVRGDGGDYLELFSTAPCRVPITGLADPDAGAVERYGDAITTFIDLPGCDGVVIPLD